MVERVKWMLEEGRYPTEAGDGYVALMRFRLAATGLAMTALISACGAAAKPTVTAGAPPAAQAQAASSPLLQFTAEKLGGGTIDGASYVGKPVAFWFWAPG